MRRHRSKTWDYRGLGSRRLYLHDIVLQDRVSQVSDMGFLRTNTSLGQITRADQPIFLVTLDLCLLTEAEKYRRYAFSLAANTLLLPADKG